MDFVRSHFGKMKLWPVAPFFPSLLESGNIQNIAACYFLYCCKEMTYCNVLYVPRFQKWVKKGATSQSFIRKEITTYRIGTLTIPIRGISFVDKKIWKHSYVPYHSVIFHYMKYWNVWKFPLVFKYTYLAISKSRPVTLISP